jgi:CUE domain
MGRDDLVPESWRPRLKSPKHPNLTLLLSFKASPSTAFQGLDLPSYFHFIESFSQMTDKSTYPELNELDPAPASQTAPAAAAPPMPARPLSPMQQAKVTLKEAFPAVDDNVIEAVLIASGGNIEPAFNALLGIAPFPCC